MPKGATILSTVMQQNNICIWCESNADTKESETRKFEFIGTDMKFDSVPRKFIGTVLSTKQNFVFHVYELL